MITMNQVKVIFISATNTNGISVLESSFRSVFQLKYVWTNEAVYLLACSTCMGGKVRISLACVFVVSSTFVGM